MLRDRGGYNVHDGLVRVKTGDGSESQMKYEWRVRTSASSVRTFLSGSLFRPEIKAFLTDSPVEKATKRYA